MSDELVQIHERLVEMIGLTEILIDEIKEFKELYQKNHKPVKKPIEEPIETDGG